MHSQNTWTLFSFCKLACEIKSKLLKFTRNVFIDLNIFWSVFSTQFDWYLKYLSSFAIKLHFETSWFVSMWNWMKTFIIQFWNSKRSWKNSSLCLEKTIYFTRILQISALICFRRLLAKQTTRTLILWSHASLQITWLLINHLHLIVISGPK